MEEGKRFENASLGDYLTVLRRRKRPFIVTLLLVPLAAAAFSFTQARAYEASADVLLSGQQLGGTVNGLANSGLSEDADRFAQTQVNVARSPIVAALTLQKLDLTDRTPRDFLANSTVVSKSNADVLVFSVTDGNESLARRLTNAYASAYTTYSTQQNSAPVASALKKIRARIATLRAAGDRGSPLLRSLLQKEGQLGTLQEVQGAPASVLHPSTGAGQIRPQPVLNIVLGVLLGLVLAAAVAFVRDATDRRVQSAQEVVEELGLDPLGFLPKLSKELTAPGVPPVVLSEPHGRAAEAFRMLRTRLALADAESPSEVIMFTSGVENDGKSTVVANLAATIARGGRRVILVDFDLRNPSLVDMFNLRTQRGLTTVAIGNAAVDNVLMRVRISGDTDSVEGRGRARKAPRAGRTEDLLPPPGEGMLQILPSGPTPPNPGEFVQTVAVRAIFSELRKRADLVLVDAPPLLVVSDATVLATMVDSIVVVANLRLARRPILGDLRRVLAMLPAKTLGVVVTGVTEDAGMYGLYGGYPALAHEDATNLAAHQPRASVGERARDLARPRSTVRKQSESTM